MVNLIIRLWAQISTIRRKQLYLLCVSIIVASFIEVLSIGSLIPFLGILINPNKIFTNELLQPLIVILKIKTQEELKITITMIFISSTVISGLARILVLWAQTKIGFLIGADFSNQIYEKTLYQPYSTHLNRNSSRVISVISSETNTVIQSCLLQILFIINSLIVFTTIFSVMLVIEPIGTFSSAIAIIFIYLFIAITTKNKLKTNSKKVNQESQQTIRALQEGLGAIKEVLIGGTQKIYCDIYKNADKNLRNSQSNIQMIIRIPRYIVETIGLVLISIFAFWLSITTDDSAKLITVLGIMAFSAQRIMPLLQQLYFSYSSIVGCKSSIIDVLFFLEQNESHKNDGITEKFKFEKYIKLNNIYFRYDRNSPWIFKNISLEIKKGDKVGIIGKTGSGKSTLLDIMTGLSIPEKGSIIIDETNVSEKNIKELQNKIAYVPQSIFLIDATIEENIAFGIQKNQINLVKVIEAAKKAQIHETVEQLQHGYKTIIGERGIRLSGGQAQRIGIARALYKKAEIIIFDEATSALDNTTEINVMDSINSIAENITIILVAHRLTSLDKCNIIYDLENGKIMKTHINEFK